MAKPWPKALLLGIGSSLFFSVTYIINNAMAQSGGDWLWSACLRYLLMLPILLLLVASTIAAFGISGRIAQAVLKKGGEGRD